MVLQKPANFSAAVEIAELKEAVSATEPHIAAITEIISRYYYQITKVALQQLFPIQIILTFPTFKMPPNLYSNATDLKLGSSTFLFLLFLSSSPFGKYLQTLSVNNLFQLMRDMTAQSGPKEQSQSDTRYSTACTTRAP